MELKNTNKKQFLLLIAFFCLGIVASVDAQQPTKVHRNRLSRQYRGHNSSGHQAATRAAKRTRLR